MYSIDNIVRYTSIILDGNKRKLHLSCLVHNVICTEEPEYSIHLSSLIP